MSLSADMSPKIINVGPKSSHARSMADGLPCTSHPVNHGMSLSDAAAALAHACQHIVEGIHKAPLEVTANPCLLI